MQNKSSFQEIQHELKLKNFELNAVLEITKGINQNKSINHLLSLFEFILKEQLGLRRFVLFKHSGNWECLVKSGIKGKIKNINISRDLSRFQKITSIHSSANTEIAQFDVIIPVLHQEQPLAYLLIQESENSSYLISNKNSIKELSFIQLLTNIIIVAIENQRLFKENIYQERFKRDLEVASEMQQLLFPSNLPSDKRLDLAAMHKARHEVSGDYYDFIPINEDDFIVCIGDVSGKGVSAAMLMANFQATIRTLIYLDKFDLEYLINELNKRVMEAAEGEKFITFFIGHYQAKKRQLKYINAGHNHPILTNGKKARFLDKGAIGLGMLKEIPFIEPEIVDIPNNSTLILYTDGVVELENATGEYFETQRLIRLIHNFYPLKMEDLNNLIFSKLDEFRGKKDFVDDTAIFSCRFF